MTSDGSDDAIPSWIYRFASVSLEPPCPTKRINIIHSSSLAARQYPIMLDMVSYLFCYFLFIARKITAKDIFLFLWVAVSVLMTWEEHRCIINSFVLPTLLQPADFVLLWLLINYISQNFRQQNPIHVDHLSLFKESRSSAERLQFVYLCFWLFLCGIFECWCEMVRIQSNSVTPSISWHLVINVFCHNN